MFRHILFPIDGSAASKAAQAPCLQFVRESGAKITCLHVAQPFMVFPVVPDMAVYTREQFAQDSAAHARKILSEFELAAKAQGVSYDTLFLTADHPYEAIIQTAQDKQCDLIAMASHGYKGVKAFLLGSETQKVLSHSKIPVLIFR